MTSVTDTVRELCLSFPEATEKLSHGSPHFRVRDRTFAIFATDHHGDGRIALWLAAPPGSQDLHTAADPDHYFVPPYVGPRGWLGVRVDRDLEWERIAARVREAYDRVAPRRLSASIGETPRVTPPSGPVTLDEFDPLRSARGEAVLIRVRAICLALPEASEVMQFGRPVWRAGKRTFCRVGSHEGRLRVSFWVGGDLQAMLADDPRYAVPAYTGHNGWIAIDVHDDGDWDEVAVRVTDSYRHFALKRMLRALDEGA